MAKYSRGPASQIWDVEKMLAQYRGKMEIWFHKPLTFIYSCSGQQQKADQCVPDEDVTDGELWNTRDDWVEGVLNI